MKIAKNKIIIISLALLFFILLSYFFLNQYKTNSIAIDCLDTAEKYNCWRDILNGTLEQQGLSASFDILAKLYDTEPDFIAECHGFTHELGEESYKLYSKYKSLEMTPKASYCGYGFYHGFVETLLHSGAPIKEAAEFCAYADQQLSAYGEKTSIACYHGIGHGAVDGSDPRNWGNPQKLITPGLNLCKTVSILPVQTELCGTGVFNALAIALNSNLYNLNSPDGPYEICLNQEPVFKKACYEQMNTRAVGLAGGNFSAALKFVMDIPSKEHAVTAMEQLVPAAIIDKVGQNNNFDEELEVCQSLPGYLQKACLTGIVGGILEFGKPDYEYLEALNFCGTAPLNELEKEQCFKFVASSSYVIYSPEKAKQICGLIDPKYKPYCN